MKDPGWKNAHLISENVLEEVAKMKDQYDRDIQVAGNGTLVQTLLENDLVDQWNLMLFPTTLGKGKRLFGDGFPRRKLKLVEDRGVGPDGIRLQIYEKA